MDQTVAHCTTSPFVRSFVRSFFARSPPPPHLFERHSADRLATRHRGALLDPRAPLRQM
jgi:hypothetical protein